jgi:glc operon protein GlcG
MSLCQISETATKVPVAVDTMMPMFKVGLLAFLLLRLSFAVDLPTKKYLSTAAIKSMVAAAESEAEKRHVQITLCIVDESGNLLFFEKQDGATLNTIQFAQRKARHAALYGSPSKNGADSVKNGNISALAFPEFFPNQGGLPIKVDGKTLGAIAASGATSDVDEAIAQAGLDALGK